MGKKNPEHKSDGLLLKYLSLRALIEKLARLGYEGEFDRGERLALRKLVNGISLHLRRLKPNRRNAHGTRTQLCAKIKYQFLSVLMWSIKLINFLFLCRNLTTVYKKYKGEISPPPPLPFKTSTLQHKTNSNGKQNKKTKNKTKPGKIRNVAEMSQGSSFYTYNSHGQEH